MKKKKNAIISTKNEENREQIQLTWIVIWFFQTRTDSVKWQPTRGYYSQVQKARAQKGTTEHSVGTRKRFLVVEFRRLRTNARLLR